MARVKEHHYHRDPCPACEGAGAVTTIEHVPTSNKYYDGVAYDEALDTCPSCQGTGLDQHYYTQGPSLEEAAEEHELITEQKEQSAWTF